MSKKLSNAQHRLLEAIESGDAYLKVNNLSRTWSIDYVAGGRTVSARIGKESPESLLKRGLIQETFGEFDMPEPGRTKYFIAPDGKVALANHRAALGVSAPEGEAKARSPMPKPDSPFEAAKAAYPERVRIGKSYWSLVDGYIASGLNPDHRGKMVLREERDGCATAFHHWGNYILKTDMGVEP